MGRNIVSTKIWLPLRRATGKIPENHRLLVLSLVVGVLSGLAAVLLHSLIDLIRHGLTSWLRTDAEYALMLVYPGIGMLLALLFTKYVIRDNIGHGVTKALVAISKNESRIRPHNMWSSVLASSVTIGFGGSVGAEAPIVYTGAAIGSNMARYMGLSYRNMTILLGCGASAAIAGIFKAPLAGVLFTLEILLFNFSMTSLMPLLLATVSAAVVAYVFMGTEPMFHCAISSFTLRNIPFYVLLGLFCGLVSLYFLRGTLSLEDHIAKIRSPWLRWLGCAVALGVLIYLFPPLYGEGYDSLGALLGGGGLDYGDRTVLTPLLGGDWAMPIFFLLVMLLKVLSMTLTNAGGGVGGTFGPTLFVGGIAGFVFSRAFNLVLAGSALSVPEQNFVLVGMAGLMAGVMQAPMTAIFLIAEMSGGYELFLPLILTSAISFGTIRIFERYSIYSKRIASSALLTHDSDQAVLTLLKVKDLIEKDYSPIAIDTPLRRFVEVISHAHRNIFPVVDSRGRFQGYVSLEDVRRDMFNQELYDKMFVYNYMHSSPAYVGKDESMDSVMLKFEKTGAWNLPVVDAERKYIGFVSRSQIFSAYRDELRELSQD